MSKKSTSDHEQFRDGIMKLNSHQFGMVGEVVVETLMKYTRSGVSEFDLRDTNGQMIEVKAAKVQVGSKKKISINNFYGVAMKYAKWDRLITQQKAASGSIPFTCNMQGIKPLLFDRLVYLLFFRDRIEIFDVDSIFLLLEDPDLATLVHCTEAIQNEGLLRIDGNTYPYHKSNHFVRDISYGDLMEIAKANKS